MVAIRHPHGAQASSENPAAARYFAALLGAENSCLEERWRTEWASFQNSPVTPRPLLAAARTHSARFARLSECEFEFGFS